jgi:hypothetical protein
MAFARPPQQETKRYQLIFHVSQRGELLDELFAFSVARR